MYAVSDAYKVAVADSHRKSKMRGVLTVGSTVINLDDNDIIKDTVYVTNKCTNGNEYEYGCTYAAECGLTIKSAVDRYSLYDAELKLYWSLWTGAEWEEIPLGVFYISEPNRVNDKISLKALDGMTKLDIEITDDTQGTMPQLVSWIAEKCGVELAQTEEELGAFVNGNVQYSVQADKVDTYRDLLAYVCQMSACFAIFDRYGKLRLVQYATEPCVTLGRKQRFTNATFSDYTTKFVGLKARFIADENYAPYEAGETGTGLILDMGDNPIVRGLPETKHAVLDAVFEVLKNVSYTPFEIETMGNPALELGDYVKNVSVGKDGKTYLSPITYYYWTYRGKHKLRAVGGNPKISGVNNKQGKQVSSLEGEISSKTIQVKSYVNAEQIFFIDTEKEIATFNYAATENSRVMFFMTVRISVSLDGVLVIKFYEDAKADEERVFKKYLERGTHFVTLTELYEVSTNDRRTLSIKAHMEYFESDKRKQDADITTNKNFLAAISTTGATVTDNIVQFPEYAPGVIDTTVPTATINKGGVKAVLYGQGIAGEGKWDGTISFSEDIRKIIQFTGGLTVDKNLTDSVNVTTQTPTGANIAVELGRVQFTGSLSFEPFNTTINIGEVIKDYKFNTDKASAYEYDKYITTNNDMFALKTIYTYTSAEETIDSGKLSVVAIDYTGLTVESVVVKNG